MDELRNSVGIARQLTEDFIVDHFNEIVHLTTLNPLGRIQNDKYHVLNFKYSLLWTHGSERVPSKRRGAFPSWTWAGWEGQIEWVVKSTKYADYKESPDYNAKFQFLRECGDESEQTTLVDRWTPLAGNASQPRGLLFTGALYDIPCRAINNSGSGQMQVYLDDSDVDHQSRLHITQLDLDFMAGVRKIFLGIWLATITVNFWLNKHIEYILVVREVAGESHGDGKTCFERIGIIVIPKRWSQRSTLRLAHGWLI